MRGKTFRNDWVEFTTGFSHFDLRYSIASYFDSRHMFQVCLGWGQLFIHLPWRSKINACEYPEYGFYYYGSKIWICLGRKNYTIGMPWEWEWVRTSGLRRDKTWEHETRGNRKDFWEKQWEDILLIEQYPYTYKLNSGEEQHVLATIRVEEREWRWKWFKWLGFPKKVRRSIHVDFSDEVGEGSGSWKGGAVACGYDLKRNESPKECLKRMERERKFTK